MNFDLSEEQLFLKKTVREFTDRKIEPIAGQIDQEGHLPDDLIKSMGQMGLLGMTLPKRYGGGEADHLSAVLACEQIAYSVLTHVTPSGSDTPSRDVQHRSLPHPVAAQR